MIIAYVITAIAYMRPVTVAGIIAAPFVLPFELLAVAVEWGLE